MSVVKSALKDIQWDVMSKAELAQNLASLLAVEAIVRFYLDESAAPPSSSSTTGGKHETGVPRTPR